MRVAQAMLQKFKKLLLPPSTTIGIDRWLWADIHHTISCPPLHQNLHRPADVINQQSTSTVTHNVRTNH